MRRYEKKNFNRNTKTVKPLTARDKAVFKFRKTHFCQKLLYKIILNDKVPGSEVTRYMWYPMSKRDYRRELNLINFAVK